jgi:hypothetical protein
MRRLLAALATAATLALPAYVCATGQPGDREFSVAGAKTLRLNVSGSVRLTGVPGLHSVVLHVADNGASPPPIEVKSSRTGSRLNLSISGPAQSLVPFAGGPGYELEISYPADLALDLREFDGQVHVENVAAPAQIYDADGSIVVDRAAAALTAEADSGDVSVDQAQTTLELTVGNGNVSARLSPGWNGQRVRLEASNGNLTLRVPAGFRAHFDLTTGSGTVTNPLHDSAAGPLIFALAQHGDVSIAPL